MGSLNDALSQSQCCGEMPKLIPQSFAMQEVQVANWHLAAE